MRGDSSFRKKFFLKLVRQAQDAHSTMAASTHFTNATSTSGSHRLLIKGQNK